MVTRKLQRRVTKEKRLELWEMLVELRVFRRIAIWNNNNNNDNNDYGRYPPLEGRRL
jgi:hypothetical protein